MFINKMGSYHASYGINNQDYGFEYENILCVVDGCSEGLHSEVGAKIFVKKFLEYLKKYGDVTTPMHIKEITDVFENVMNMIVDHDNFIEDMRNYMCFTIMVSQKLTNQWITYVFGDGFIITQDYDDIIEFINVDHSSTPNYLAYQYINPEYMEKTFDTMYTACVYDDTTYKNIGIASDGLAYIIGHVYEHDFKKLLTHQKDFAIKRFINKLNVQHHDGNGFFKDDITIALTEVEK